jgi:hypothetical protein
MSSSWRDFPSLDFDGAAEMIVRAHERDGESVDLPVMALQTYGVVPIEGHFGLASLAKTRPPMPLRATAFSNLMTRLGAPADFVRDRLPQPLQLATANWLLQTQDKSVPATLRLRGDEVAAIVSERYAPLDPEPLFDLVRDVLEQQGLIDQVEVKSLATGVVDVMRLVFPARQVPVKVGDMSALGIDISTSSFGKSAVHVRGIIWRLRCTNGLRVAERMGNASFRHVGDVDRLKAGIGEAIPAALTMANGTLDRWKAAVTTMVTDIPGIIAGLRDLTIGERELVTTEVKREAGVTALPEHLDLYAFINGITSAAQQSAPARRLEIETMAGEMLQSRTS